MKILSGRSHKELGRRLAALAEIEYVEAVTGEFKDGELWVQIPCSLSGEEVLILQSTSRPANDNIMELLLLADAAKQAEAKATTLIIPYFGYSRQDRQSHFFSPISASLIANILETTSVQQIITIDLHSEQIENFFTIELQNLDPIPLFIPFIESSRNPVIVCPDIGSLNRGRKISSILGTKLAIIDKHRHNNNEYSMNLIAGEVKEKDCILIDDIVDTSGTLCQAAELLIEHGAASIDAFVTHAVLSSNAREKIQSSAINRIYVTDTINVSQLPPKFQVIPIDQLLLTAIKKI